MNSSESLQQQITDLECKFAFQQETIDTLNSEVTKQWSIIDALTKKIERMTNQLLTLDDTANDTRNEPPPPHY